jgi:hypothetical protein
MTPFAWGRNTRQPGFLLFETKHVPGGNLKFFPVIHHYRRRIFRIFPIMADIDNTLSVTLVKCFSRQVFQQLLYGNLRFVFESILKIKPTIGLLVFHVYQFAVIMRDFPVPGRDFHFQAVEFHFRLHGP